MLRIASDVFDEMLGTAERTEKMDEFISPRFDSSVMERVKFFCHVGDLVCVPKNDIDADELNIVLEVMVAADYYDIGALGGKCLDYLKSVLDVLPNFSFVVANKFGVDYSNESRSIVASAIFYAFEKVLNFNEAVLYDNSINVISEISDPTVLEGLLQWLLRFYSMKPLLAINFLEKWADLSSSKNAESIARELVAKSKVLVLIATFSPDHLTDPKSVLRTFEFGVLLNYADLLHNILSQSQAHYSIFSRLPCAVSLPGVQNYILLPSPGVSVVQHN
jgi:hypothetical protein